MLIHNEDDIEFVTEFPCFLGHPVPCRDQSNTIKFKSYLSAYRDEPLKISTISIKSHDFSYVLWLKFQK